MATRFGYNSTIARKEKICRSCGKPCYPFSKGRCQPCSTREDTMKRMEAATEEIIKEENLGDLIKDADALVSQIVRMSAADSEGMVKCFTCPTIMRWQDAHAGHYIGRSNMLLRFDWERNIRVQCPYCNCGKHGNLAIFAQNLEIQNPGLPDILMEERAIVFKINRDELKQIILDASIKVTELKKKLKNGA